MSKEAFTTTRRVSSPLVSSTRRGRAGARLLLISSIQLMFTAAPQRLRFPPAPENVAGQRLFLFDRDPRRVRAQPNHAAAPQAPDRDGHFRCQSHLEPLQLDSTFEPLIDIAPSALRLILLPFN